MFMDITSISLHLSHALGNPITFCITVTQMVTVVTLMVTDPDTAMNRWSVHLCAIRD
jgi:hypothetical protein